MANQMLQWSKALGLFLGSYLLVLINRKSALPQTCMSKGTLFFSNADLISCSICVQHNRISQLQSLLQVSDYRHELEGKAYLTQTASLCIRLVCLYRFVWTTGIRFKFSALQMIYNALYLKVSTAMHQLLFQCQRCLPELVLCNLCLMSHTWFVCFIDLTFLRV